MSFTATRRRSTTCRSRSARGRSSPSSGRTELARPPSSAPSPACTDRRADASRSAIPRSAAGRATGFAISASARWRKAGRYFRRSRSQRISTWARCSRARVRSARKIERVFALFPVLGERLRQAAGTLSGGEQQMLAIGRCLMGAPELVMFDEPSLGLAPAIVQHLLRTIRDLNREGLTCVLVEQNVAVSLKLAAQAYVLENGRITLSGAGETLLADDRVRRAYLGL